MDFEIRHRWDEQQGDEEVDTFRFQVGHSFLDDHHVALWVFDACLDLFHQLIDVVVAVVVGIFEADGEFQLDGSEEVRWCLKRSVGIFPFFFEGFHDDFMDLLAGHKVKEPYEDISFWRLFAGMALGGIFAVLLRLEGPKKGNFESNLSGA